jgi:hypothetical protein
MLMGQADKDAIKIPATKVVFIEDLTPEERARHLKENAGVPRFLFIDRLCFLSGWSTWVTLVT